MLAWQLTTDDITTVFINEFKKQITEEEAENILELIDTDSIIKSVLSSTDFDEQCNISYNCIKEEILKLNIFN